SVTREGLLLAEWPGGSAVDGGHKRLMRGRRRSSPGHPRHNQHPDRVRLNGIDGPEKRDLHGASASPLGKKSCLILIYFSPSASLHWIRGMYYADARVLYLGRAASIL